MNLSDYTNLLSIKYIANKILQPDIKRYYKKFPSQTKQKYPAREGHRNKKINPIIP